MEEVMDSRVSQSDWSVPVAGIATLVIAIILSQGAQLVARGQIGPVGSVYPHMLDLAMRVNLVLLTGWLAGVALQLLCTRTRASRRRR